jgi:pimeloyl-ACP methyl ester carboxylesterase
MLSTNTTPIVILGGFGSNYNQYRKLQSFLVELSGRPVSIAPISLIDWIGVVTSDSYGDLLRIVHKAVQSALTRNQAQRVTLVGHSAGGVLARIYMGDQPYGAQRLVYNGFNYVDTLVTLGTPHNTRSNGRHGGHNQIAFAQETYPGAYWRFVRYISVMGKDVFGSRSGHSAERGAWQSYQMLDGDGYQWGDGVIPLRSGLLAGSYKVVVEGLRHDQRPESRWYGSSIPAVRSWWEQVVHAEARPTAAERWNTADNVS